MSDARCYFGLYPALVTDIVDPDRQGRIQVSFPWLGDDRADARYWATLLTPYADDDQGFVVLPETGTQVIVGFEFGDLQRSYIVGSCWNGQEMMPVTPTRPNNRRLIKTRSGAVLDFDDTAGAAKVTVASGSGHTVVLDDGAGTIKIHHQAGHTITLAATQITIDATGGTVLVNAAAVNVDALSTTFSGTVTCTTLTATSVVSPSYTPGAGNVW
jgi:uncharacterized protein involved in type VI secretion and phage assembly